MPMDHDTEMNSHHSQEPIRGPTEGEREIVSSVEIGASVVLGDNEVEIFGFVE